MDRAQKRDVVATLHGAIAESGVIVVAHYAGLSVSDMTSLRRDMRSAGGQVKVAKNRLVKLALEGTEATAGRVSEQVARRARPLVRDPDRRRASIHCGGGRHFVRGAGAGRAVLVGPLE